MARPTKEIEQTQFEKLCAMLATEEEIAGFFDCSVDTIERWCKRTYKVSFAEIYKTHSAKGKISIRRNQLKLSEKYPAMAIWLGKQYLGQRDIPIEVDHTVSPIDEITKLIFERQQEQADTEEDIDE